MSKIEQLIQELCPGGVVKLPLEELCEFRNGYTPSKANKEFWEDGNIPWFRMEDIREGGRILSDSKQHITQKAIKGAGLFKANSIILATTATIGEHAMIIADSLANQQFTNLSIRKSLSLSVLPKYLFYYMFLVDEWCKNHVNVSGFASVDMAGLKKLEIPLPPLPIQQEIVRILDTFTEAQANLEQELELRKKQYEYYRNQLLTFDENDSSVKWMKLENIVSKNCSISYGIVQPGDDTEDGVPVVRPVDLTKTIVTNNGLKRTSFENSNAYKRTILKGGELLLCVRGTTGIVSIASNELKGCNVTRGIVPLAFDNEITRSYMFYLFNSKYIQNEIGIHTNGTALRQINIKDLKVIQFPITDLSRQQEIVSILDKFESAIQTLEEELALRKKQYEYYREKLLTFN